MERDRVVRVLSDVAVGVAAAWLLKRVGVKQGTVAAVIGAALIHEMLDAPVAARIQESM